MCPADRKAVTDRRAGNSRRDLEPLNHETFDLNEAGAVSLPRITPFGYVRSVGSRGQRSGRTKDEEEPEAKKRREELYTHPVYEENAPKVILVSSDGQRFCVDRRTLSTYR
jgi:hypothetical protein